MLRIWTIASWLIVMAINVKVNGERPINENRYPTDVALALSRVKRDTDTDPNESGKIDKKFLGRWKNFRYLLGNSDDKRFFGRWRNANYLRDIKHKGQEDADKMNKRFLGRWKNRNWQLQRSNLDDSADVYKRFFGRWKNRNYQVSKNKNTRDVGKRFFGRWKNRNYKLSKANEDLLGKRCL